MCSSDLKALSALEAVCASGELSAALNQAAARPDGDGSVKPLQVLAAALKRAAAEGAQWRAGFEQAAASAPERPLGDMEGAARALAAACGRERPRSRSTRRSRSLPGRSWPRATEP